KLDAEAARMIAVRFDREVKAVAKINHPNVVQVYDFGNEGDLAYIVMEFVEGQELKTILDAGERLELRTTFTLMTQLLDALDSAHAAGVVHRDIKPANVMVTTDGRAKLADFGVARVSDTDANAAEATRLGTMVGTPAYMSPEQMQGQRLDFRSDLFSIGILFYEMLTGQRPFSGTQWALAKMIIEDDPAWPSTIVQVPPAFDRVVAKALAKDPAKRYASARKFSEALQRILKGEQPEEPGEVAVQPGAVAAASAAPAMPFAGGEADAEFWNEVKDSDDADEIELYLEQFPGGQFAAQARKRIEELGG
ncbi:MAG: serine/threonine-protein kinase, partial [Proteobacteria bacterium]|nr:serine/threonine-protein kinase [Pseudomonadota bacterium]